MDHFSGLVISLITDIKQTNQKLGSIIGSVGSLAEMSGLLENTV